MLWIGLIAGIIIGYKLNKIKIRIDNGIKFKLLGYEFYIGKKKKAEVIPMKKKKSTKLKVDKCKICNGEDMFISGTKHLIPCPTCKRNANKFKAPAN